MKIRRRKLEVGVPYLPMADIAFNLVLFFIMLAKTQDQTNLQWEPARVPHVEKNIGEAHVSVAVDKDGKVYLNGTQVSIGQLTGEVEKQLGDNPAGKRLVQLKVHKDTLASTFEPLIEAVSNAGGEVVHVLEEDKKTP